MHYYSEMKAPISYIESHVVCDKVPLNRILCNAAKVLTGRSFDRYEKGIAAYDAWRTALLNEQAFQREDNLSLTYEKLLTHDDAVGCLLDGRSNASSYFRQLSQKSANHTAEYEELAKLFHRTCLAADRMVQALGGWENQKERCEYFLQPEKRRQIAALTEEAKAQDTDALKILNKLIST